MIPGIISCRIRQTIIAPEPPALAQSLIDVGSDFLYVDDGLIFNVGSYINYPALDMHFSTGSNQQYPAVIANIEITSNNDSYVNFPIFTFSADTTLAEILKPTIGLQIGSVE